MNSLLSVRQQAPYRPTSARLRACRRSAGKQSAIYPRYVRSALSTPSLCATLSPVLRCETKPPSAAGRALLTPLDIVAGRVLECSNGRTCAQTKQRLRRWSSERFRGRDCPVRCAWTRSHPRSEWEAAVHGLVGNWSWTRNRGGWANQTLHLSRSELGFIPTVQSSLSFRAPLRDKALYPTATGTTEAAVRTARPPHPPRPRHAGTTATAACPRRRDRTWINIESL
jgi:hypothetical protein